MNNFKFREGMIGRYDIKIIESELVDQIIQAYTHDVTMASFAISTEIFENATVTISNTGYITVTCNEKEFGGLFLFLKTILFKEG